MSNVYFLTTRLEWHPVLDASIGSNLTSVNASRELQLLLERKRLPALGINSYEFHKKSGKIIFQACNSLYMCHDTGFNVSPASKREILLKSCLHFEAALHHFPYGAINIIPSTTKFDQLFSMKIMFFNDDANRCKQF